MPRGFTGSSREVARAEHEGCGRPHCMTPSSWCLEPFRVSVSEGVEQLLWEAFGVLRAEPWDLPLGWVSVRHTMFRVFP